MKFGKDVEALLRKLLLGYRQYFHSDVLNSDGRKLFEEILRMIVHEHPELRRSIYRLRRAPTIDSVLKLAKIVLGRREAEEVYKIGVYGLYDEGYMMNNNV